MIPKLEFRALGTVRRQPIAETLAILFAVVRTVRSAFTFHRCRARLINTAQGDPCDALPHPIVRRSSRGSPFGSLGSPPPILARTNEEPTRATPICPLD